MAVRVFIPLPQSLVGLTSRATTLLAVGTGKPVWQSTCRELLASGGCKKIPGWKKTTKNQVLLPEYLAAPFSTSSCHEDDDIKGCVRRAYGHCEYVLPKVDYRAIDFISAKVCALCPLMTLYFQQCAQVAWHFGKLRTVRVEEEHPFKVRSSQNHKYLRKNSKQSCHPKICSPKDNNSWISGIVSQWNFWRDSQLAEMSLCNRK